MTWRFSACQRRPLIEKFQTSPLPPTAGVQTRNAGRRPRGKRPRLSPAFPQLRHQVLPDLSARASVPPPNAEAPARFKAELAPDRRTAIRAPRPGHRTHFEPFAGFAVSFVCALKGA